MDPLEEYVKQEKAFVREQREDEGQMQQEARASVQEGDHSPSQGSWNTNLTQYLRRIKQRIREQWEDEGQMQQQGWDFVLIRYLQRIRRRRSHALHGKPYKLYL